MRRDDGMRAFMAARGYPDRDLVAQVRKISPADTRTPTRRICSASLTRKVSVSSPEIRQIVDDIYPIHLELPAEWTPQQRREFVEGEAARISLQVAQMAADLGEQAVAEWTSR